MDGQHTRAVHGEGRDEHGSGPLGVPLVRTSAYRFASLAELQAASAGSPCFYTRYGHPNFERVEAHFAALHGVEDAVLFASGMAATAGLLLAHVRSGARLVAQEEIYGGTDVLLRELAERFAVDVVRVPAGDLPALEAALPGAVLYLGESPINPRLGVIDLDAVSATCHAAGVPFALDATFDGPINLQPARLGVDFVLESATKSLGGHSDLMAGLVGGRRAALDALRRTRRIHGGVADPETAWLLERGMRTLAVRVERQNATASELARRLESVPQVEGVRHPALASHPQRALIEGQARRGHGTGSGGMIAFRVRAGAAAAEALVDGLRLFAHAPTLGGVESLVCIPRHTSHAAVPADLRLRAGITDDLVRLSIGLEDVEDLWADLRQALGPA